MTDEWTELLEHESYADTAGRQTHYFDVGEGDPVFLIHGGGLTSSAEQNWGAVILPLSEECRVVAVDQPGFGFTDLRDEDEYTAEYNGQVIDYSAPDLDVPALVTWSTTPEVFPRVHYQDNEELAREIEEYFGDMDPIEPALCFVEGIDDAELHLWDEAKHHVMTDHAPRWVDVVSDFIDSSDPTVV